MRPDDTTRSIPHGFCQCGCGGRTKIATQTRSERGQRRGEPMPYIRQHRIRKSPHDYIVDPDTGCWNWQLAKDRRGYGRRYWQGRQGRPAHRVAYEIAHGPIPAGMVVMHLCDNPSCVNPSHLTLGDVSENNHDRDRKGRQVAPSGDTWRAAHEGKHPIGEQHPNARIDTRTAREIKRLIRDGEGLADIAKALGVSYNTVTSIAYGRTWRHA